MLRAANGRPYGLGAVGTAGERPCGSGTAGEGKTNVSRETFCINGYGPQFFGARKTARVLRLLPEAGGKKPGKKQKSFEGITFPGMKNAGGRSDEVHGRTGGFASGKLHSFRMPGRSSAGRIRASPTGD